MTIHEKLSLIQKEFKAKKSRYNSFGKYNFRSAEDILEALKPFNEKYKVYFTVSETLVGDSIPIIVSQAAIHDATDLAQSTSITASAVVGVDLNQKGMQTPQQFGSASSYAKKYSLGNLLLIDDTADADATNKHDTKPALDIGTEAMNKAIEYVKNGGDISAINSKYKVSIAAKAELKKHEQR
jgi:hypothetical protein|tara:strand:+ start:1713 stop:2261 length:549 start_codon:yes stop_codon:yes gene_type:complete